MKKTLIITLVALFSVSSFAAVIKKRDNQNGCTIFKVVAADEQGKIKLQKGEEVVIVKDTYGLSIQDMEVNFDNREVMVTPVANIVLGINRALTLNKVAVQESNADFTFIINQLNRKVVNLFEEMCITNDNKLAYVKVFEPTPVEETKRK